MNTVIAHQESKFEKILEILQKNLTDSDKKKITASIGSKVSSKDSVKDQLSKAFRKFYKD